MFSQTAEYALRAAVWLADHEGGACTNAAIAEGTQVPSSYLSKVLQALVRGGIVSSQRGLGGGFSLRRPASEISVLDVIDAVDPLRRIDTCPLNIAAHGHKLCPLHHKLDQALAQCQSSFASTSLAELVRPADGGEALCPPVGLANLRGKQAR